MGSPTKNKKKSKKENKRANQTTTISRRKKKYAEDAEYHERVKAESRAYYYRHRQEIIARVAKRQQEKCEADPKYHEKRNAANRAYYQRNHEERKEANRAYRVEHRDEINAVMRLKWSSDPEYRKCHNAQSAEGHRRRRYGVTPEDYERMLKEQDGCCAMCKRYFGRALRVDHCHKTGRVRRLLCHGCNVGFGFFREDANALRAAADYAEEFNGSALAGGAAAISSRVAVRRPRSIRVDPGKPEHLRPLHPLYVSVSGANSSSKL